MKIQEAQSQVDQYISGFREGYFPPLNNLARLMEEVGELSRELNHRFGMKKKKPEKALSDGCCEELGDIFFTVITLANQLDVDLSQALNSVIQKYSERDQDRWTQKNLHNPTKS